MTHNGLPIYKSREEKSTRNVTKIRGGWILEFDPFFRYHAFTLLKSSTKLPAGSFFVQVTMEYLPLLPILLLSVILHEISHGWMALRLGDPTARDLGRLTLNPIPHIDPVGSILIPLLSLFAAGTVFIAWAKPVPINPANFKKYRRDDILVSVVGPLSNLLIALFCAVAYGTILSITGSVNTMPDGSERDVVLFVLKMFSFGITMNIFLAVFNLIPVPPLDGSHVVASLLPPRLGAQYRRIGFAGIILILLAMRVPLIRDGIVSLVRAIEIPYEFIIHLLS